MTHRNHTLRDKEVKPTKKGDNWKKSLFALQGMYDESLSFNDMRANDDKRQKKLLRHISKHRIKA